MKRMLRDEIFFVVVFENLEGGGTAVDGKDGFDCSNSLICCDLQPLGK